MPRIGEKFASDLSWQEELGIEPIGGYPTAEDIAKKTNDEIINGLIVTVEHRNSTDGLCAKYWQLYSTEFWRRVAAPRVDSERIEVSIATKFSKLLKHFEEIKNLINKPV